MSEPDALNAYKTMCLQIVGHGGSDLSWSWDERFDAAVAQIKSKKAPALEAAVGEALHAQAWTPDTLADAPAVIHSIVKIFGGLDSKQKLFVTAADDSTRLIVAWWPWQDGKNVSLRFLLQSERLKPDECGDVIRGWLGL